MNAYAKRKALRNEILPESRKCESCGHWESPKAWIVIADDADSLDAELTTEFYCRGCWSARQVTYRPLPKPLRLSKP